MVKKRNYDGWTENDYQKEIENLDEQKTYGLVWEKNKEDVKENFDYYINWEGIKNKEEFKGTEHKFPVLREIKNKEILTNKKDNYNLLIEGDNYHSLAVLKFTHNKQIDVIYIEPPYNTGNGEFRFNDKHVDKNDNYKHSKWLTFMEKRLELAQKLLKKTGIILIHIDKNEMAQLKILCDKIFKQNNYIENIIWRKKEGGGQQDDFFVTEHEYILAYAKNKSKFSIIEKKTKKVSESYKHCDENNKRRYNLSKLAKWGSGALKEDRPTMHFPIKDPDGNDNLPIAPDGRPGRWRYGKINLDGLIEKNCIEWKKKDNKWIPYEKCYESQIEEHQILKQRSIFYDYATTRDGTNELTEIFGKKDVFPNPKPTLLGMELLTSVADKNAIILDFFAGSGTTGHAVLKLNKLDGGNRRFILCTNDEEKICTEVCYPRISKVMKGYTTNKKIKVGGLGTNLKYFKTAFVDSKPTDKNKKILTEKAIELLCVKEGTFDLIINHKKYKIFRNHDHYSGIIFDQLAIDDFKNKIKNIQGKFSIYIFSLGDDTFDEEFSDLNKKIKLSPIPEAILRVYRRIFGK